MSVERMTKNRFSSEYQEVVEAGEPVAITRHGLVEGYWIPAQKVTSETVKQIESEKVKQWHAE